MLFLLHANFPTISHLLFLLVVTYFTKFLLLFNGSSLLKMYVATWYEKRQGKVISQFQKCVYISFCLSSQFAFCFFLLKLRWSKNKSLSIFDLGFQTWPMNCMKDTILQHSRATICLFVFIHQYSYFFTQNPNDCLNM